MNHVNWRHTEHNIETRLVLLIASLSHPLLCSAQPLLVSLSSTESAITLCITIKDLADSGVEGDDSERGKGTVEGGTHTQGSSMLIMCKGFSFLLSNTATSMYIFCLNTTSKKWVGGVLRIYQYRAETAATLYSGTN